ncbi:MAG: carbohydrate kinase family protein [Candidatus Woesearchaeota archaeon]
MNKFDIITFGSNTVDNFIYSDSELIEIKAPHFKESLLAYPYGSKLLIKDFSKSIGGGGTNTSVSFSRLGLKTAYCGVIGKDNNGIEVINKLKSENVTFVGEVKELPTGFSVILDSFEKDRTILTYKGANNHLTYDDLNFDKLNTDWFYFSSLVEESFETMKELFSYANKNNIKVAFNPSSYQVENLDLSDLNYVDFLIFNKEEAQSLLNDKSLSIKGIISNLSNYTTPIITNGKDGAYTIQNKLIYHIVPNDTKVIESTGAGDAYASGFIYGKIKDFSNKESLKIGLLNSESVISHKSAKKGLLTKKALNKKLKQTNFKIEQLN